MPVRLAMQEGLRAGVASPHPQIASLSRELLSHWEALWTFSRVEGVEPTGYPLGERGRAGVAASGAVALGSFGSRSAEGCRFAERMLSVRATCAQQQRELFAFVTAAVAAAWAGAAAPSLIPAPACATSGTGSTPVVRSDVQTLVKWAA
jgi:transposase